MKKRAFTPLEITAHPLSYTMSNKKDKTCYTNITFDGRKRQRRFLSLTGFTLIELMLVVIIIGVLAAMVMPRLVGQSEQARIARASADIASISTALDMFELHNGRFPATEEGLAALRANPSDLTAWKGPYLKKESIDSWGKPYIYKSPGKQNADYDLSSCGPNGIEGDKDDIGNW